MAQAGRRWRLVRARREAVPGSVRRMHWVRRPSLRAVRRLLWVLPVAFVVGLVGWIGYGTSVLGVQEVAVTGSVLADPEQVRALAAVADGTPLARVDTSQVEARVRMLPSVASVEVSRRWPNTLLIEVVERVPVGVVAGDAGFAVLDAEGVVFNRLPERPAGVALLRLATPGPDDPATRAALKVLASLTPPLREPLVELVAEAPTRIHLRLTDDRVVVWGDAERGTAKATVATALLGTEATTIDVSVPDVATTS